MIESLERDMELLCVTGVEDKLQDNVRNTLEQLRNAGVKVWMLTGDKLETATCIAKSSRLVSKTQNIFVFKNIQNRNEAHQELNAFRRKQDTALVISGKSLEVCLEYYEHEFIELATTSPSVVCCRCTPEQKAQVVRLIQQHTGKQTAAIGKVDIRILFSLKSISRNFYIENMLKLSFFYKVMVAMMFP